MGQIEIQSWQILDSLKEASNRTIGQLTDQDSEEIKYLFIQIELDFFELCYNQFDSSYIRHFEDEEEWILAFEERKVELNFDSYDLEDTFSDNIDMGDSDSADHLDDFSIKHTYLDE